MNNRLIRKLIIRLAPLAATIFVGIFVVYSWYVGPTSPSFEISSAKVSSETILYKGVDFDKDGYLDVSYDSSTNPASYVPKYNPVAQQGQSAVGKNDGYYEMVFDNVMPSNIYTFKVKITNNGDVSAYVSFLVNKTSKDLDCVKCFSVQVSRDGFSSTDFSEKQYLAKMSGSSSYLQFYLDSDNPITFVTTDNRNIHEYIIRFKMETFDVLTAQGIFTDDETGWNAYQALKGKTYSQTDFLEVLLTSNLPS